jgi:hypothetical protein
VSNVRGDPNREERDNTEMATDLKKPVSYVLRGCNVGPNITPDLEVTIRPRGVITIRELRRKQLVDLDLGLLYCRQLLQDARTRR